jgi:hypothetical protein
VLHTAYGAFRAHPQRARSRTRVCAYASYAQGQKALVCRGFARWAAYACIPPDGKALQMTGFHTYAPGHPADSLADVPVELTRAGISPAEYMRLRQAAALAVIEAFFDEVAEQDEDEWARQVGCALSALKRQQPRPPYEQAWLIVVDEYPPPSSWLPRNTRERDALAARGFVPAFKRGTGEESALLFLYRTLGDAYTA